MSVTVPNKVSNGSTNIETVPEPATKRKTLVERAGEPPRPNSGAQSLSRSVNSAVTSAAQAGPRNTSFSSSVSNASRTTSATSRTTSASSNRSVVGSIGRAAGNHLRPHTAMSHTRTVQPTQNGTGRPVTANGDHDTSDDQPILGKRKGRIPSYLSSATPNAPESFQSFVQRQRQKPQAVIISSGPFRTPARRPIAASAQHQQHVNPSNQPFRELSLTSAFNNMTISSESTHEPDNTFDIDSRKQNCKPVSTPSHIPRLALPTLNLLEPPTLFQPTSCQSPQSPTPLSKHSHSQQTRSSSPQRQFLNRFSNTEAPTSAWDTKGRLEDMESLYSRLKTQLDSTTFDRNALEETVNLYKTRSTSLSICFQLRMQGLLE